MHNITLIWETVVHITQNVQDSPATQHECLYTP